MTINPLQPRWPSQTRDGHFLYGIATILNGIAKIFRTGRNVQSPVHPAMDVGSDISNDEFDKPIRSKLSGYQTVLEGINENLSEMEDKHLKKRNYRT